MPRLSKVEQRRREQETEQRRREQEATEARIRSALRWTEIAPPPDVLPPERGGLSTGYLFNAPTNRVDVACSSAVSHAFGQTDQTTSQGARRLYATRRLALKALRNAVERQCAERLAAIDQMIDRESEREL